ncbi:hypothetical protein DQ04_02821060 [Trypanosoma grayi]|uniref:hypothetical protein n=1 Tax=Trypanosoma grayi TaxID=71804 RepID=UPI0004F439AF|nr:hypothetical protein DQ04_02821060 [Trypanosoma grayi]KEG11244.1 hypothetical protein DQ04_02821060 [Trypanosoma grayi]
MNRLSIIHAFETESTFLVNVPASILRQPTTRSQPPQSRGSGSDADHEAFMYALASPTTSPQRPPCEGDEGNDMSVMRVMPINGSETFHAKFLMQCEAYCRLCRRLRRAAEWLLVKQPRQRKRTAVAADGAASDVDCLSQIVYPLEPTAFVTAAFSLPSLVSVASALPDEETPTKPGGGANAARNHATSSSASEVRVVPYCFFYGFPQQNVLRNGNDGGVVRTEGSAGAAYAKTAGAPLMERFAAVATAVGVCGAAAPAHNAQRVDDRTRCGLTLAAYLEGRLPPSVSSSGGGATATMTGRGKEGSGGDPFSRWSDDILWRLLGSLVSALTVAHAAGFHYRGELSAEDVICFSLPSDDNISGNTASISNPAAGETNWRGQSRAVPIGQQLAAWTAAGERRWAITDTTPAHHAFFTLATLPRSLFDELPRDPAIGVNVRATAQRKDTAAVGRILVAVVEAAKRRRGAYGEMSCAELLFVAERIAAVDGAGCAEAAAAAAAAVLETPAHRFAQLQAIRLRSHLWLLRVIVQERDAQLAMANFDKSSCNNTGAKNWSNSYTEAGTNDSERGRRLPTPASTGREEAQLAKLQERERILSEREEKLNRFLVLYELTAERLDRLPVGKEGFDRLRRSLLQTPRSQASATANAGGGGGSSTPSGSSPARKPSQRNNRRSVGADAVTADRTRPLYGLLRFSKGDSPSVGTTTAAAAATGASAAANTMASNTAMGSSMSRSSPGLPSRGRRTMDATPHQGGPRATSEGASRRAVASSYSLSMLHSNWRAMGQSLAREGVGSAATNARVSSTCRQKSTSPGASSRLPTCRVDSPSALASLTAPTASSLAKERANMRVPSANAGSSAAAAAAANEVPLQRLTPTRGRRRTPFGGQTTSALLSPDVSPLMRVVDDTSSLMLSTSYKTPPRPTLMVTPPQSSNSPGVNAWSKVAALRSAASRGDSPAQLHASISPRHSKNMNTAYSPGPVASQSPCNMTRGKSPRYTPSLYVKGTREATPTLEANTSATTKTATLMTPPKTIPVTGTVGTPPMQSLTSKGTGTLPQHVRSGPTREEHNGGNVQVIRMHDDSYDSLPLDNSRDTPLGRSQGGNTTRSGTTSNRSPGAARPVFGDTYAPTALSLDLSSNTHDNRQTSESRQRSQGRQQRRQELEGGTTPRTSRLRLADDGWVDHHLAALEQLRYDFKKSEASKSARNTPNSKSNTKNSRGNYADVAEPPTLSPERRSAGKVSAWDGRNTGPDAAATTAAATRAAINSTGTMY